MEGVFMFSNRSTWLALAAVLALTNTSCQSSEHALAVKDDSSSDVHARPQAVQPASHEFEYFEGDAAPAMPAALPETRPSAPSAAHVWIAGHHTRQAGDWTWVSGHYEMPPEAGDIWVPGHWVSHLNGYVWIDGAWR